MTQIQKRILTTAAKTLLLLIGIGSSAVANPHAMLPDNSLHGLSTVVVRFDGMDRELAPYGLDRIRLESSISLLLKDAGLRVLSAPVEADAHPVDTITVSLRLQTTLYQFYLYNVNISLHSPLPLAHGDAYTMLETWSAGETGALLPNELGRLESTTLQIVNRFVSDYQDQK